MTTATHFTVGDVNRTTNVLVTAGFILSLGFQADQKDKRAILWKIEDFPRVIEAIAKHILAQKGKGPTPAPPKEPKEPKARKTATPPAADDDEL